MDRVRNLVAAGDVSVALAQDRDRFARESTYHYLLKRAFEEHGTKMRSLNDRGDDSAEAELMNGILDQLAKFERAKMAERTRRGKLRKAREGKIIAGRYPTFGFGFNETQNGYEVDEEGMPVVRRNFRLVAEDTPRYAVKKCLEREGVPAPKGGKHWSRSYTRRVVYETPTSRTPSRRLRLSYRPRSPPVWPVLCSARSLFRTHGRSLRIGGRGRRRFALIVVLVVLPGTLRIFT
jgi:site-specific DNA recombinase